MNIQIECQVIVSVHLCGIINDGEEGEVLVGQRRDFLTKYAQPEKADYVLLCEDVK